MLGLRRILGRLLFDSPISGGRDGDDDSYMYVFYEFGSGPIGYSLYKMNIKNPDVPETILEMNREEYPKGMGCANVGFNVYFMGGEVKEYETSNKMYVLDLKNICSGVKEAPPMRFGRPNPVPVVVNNKIYVFEGGYHYYNSRPPNRSARRDASAIADYRYQYSYFEAFDTASNQWDPLPQYTHYWGGPYSGISVARNVIFMYKGDAFTMECFDTNTCKWNNLRRYRQSGRKFDTDDPNQVLAHVILLDGIVGRGVVIDDTLFALRRTSEFSLKLVAFHLLNDAKTTEFRYVPDLDFSIGDEGSQPTPGELVHLGGYKFCLISFVSPPLELFRSPPPHPPCEKEIKFTIFELTKHHDPLSWSAELLDHVTLDADPGSFIHCFTPSVYNTRTGDAEYCQ